jgi:hypothetical protein
MQTALLLLGQKVCALSVVRDLCKQRTLTNRIAYISNRRLLLSLADAGGRLMYAYKDLQEVAGLTGR